MTVCFFSTRICRSHEPPTRTEERRRSPSSRLQNRWEATRFCSTMSGFALNIYNQKAYYWSCTATIPTGLPAVAPAMFIRNNRSEHQNLGSILWRKGWKYHLMSIVYLAWKLINEIKIITSCCLQLVFSAITSVWSATSAKNSAKNPGLLAMRIDWIVCSERIYPRFTKAAHAHNICCERGTGKPSGHWILLVIVNFPSIENKERRKVQGGTLELNAVEAPKHFKMSSSRSFYWNVLPLTPAWTDQLTMQKNGIIWKFLFHVKIPHLCLTLAMPLAILVCGWWKMCF